MRVIDGDYKGKTGRIVSAVFKGPVIQVAGETYSLNKDIRRCKELNKSENRTFMQLIVVVLLAITLIGLPIAILLFILWKKIQFTVGVQTTDGKKFVFESSDRSEYKLISKFYGVGATLDF
jgi:hypothetical protein